MHAIPPELLIFGIIVFAVGVLMWIFWRHQEEARADRLAAVHAEAEEFVERARRGLTPINTRLILKKNEHAFLEEESTLFETRAYRVYGGGGTRIKGIYIGGGASESHQRLKEIDRGTLTLTNQRLVFDGSHENRNLQLSQVMSVSPWRDAIEVSTQRRAKSQVYSVANPLIWSAMVEAIAAGRIKEQTSAE
jgi:hypothetical protein